MLIMTGLRDLIEKELKKDGINQTILAKRIGISQPTIYKILYTDTKQKYETRKKVADYFRIPVAQFYDDIGVTENVTVRTSTPPPDWKIDDLQRSIVRLYESLVELQNQLVKIDHNLGQEIGTIKDRLMDAASSGDIKRLDIMTIKGPSRVN